ncbi:hypothetical protein C8A00DRAFT_32973 [Chaetomidium leptoderma]|uniref:Uncharacterized protein n=1 Tax=Chaetomidium leptoderma TaxID=669021 RepID=A0AAN6VMB5_9PEZI|nr:hypothetical protein C8A00DRAFT_32973 [Chaetomidium leptoderma]
MPTGRTENSIKCTNTAVRSFDPTVTYTSTHIVAGIHSLTSETQVCRTATSRWLSTPSFVTPSATPWWDPAYYTDGTTIVTVSEPVPRTVDVTVSTDVVVTTFTVCNNPGTETTFTYYTRTTTLFTTIYDQRTDCSSSSDGPSSPTATTATESPAPTPRRRRHRRNAAALADSPKNHDQVQQQPDEQIRKRQESGAPLSTETVMYTTTGMLAGGSVLVTVTVTGIATTFVQTITTVHNVGATVTAVGTTRVVLGCSSSSSSSVSTAVPAR